MCVFGGWCVCVCGGGVHLQLGTLCIHSAYAFIKEKSTPLSSDAVPSLELIIVKKKKKTETKGSTKLFCCCFSRNVKQQFYDTDIIKDVFLPL